MILPPNFRELFLWSLNIYSPCPHTSFINCHFFLFLSGLQNMKTTTKKPYLTPKLLVKTKYNSISIISEAWRRKINSPEVVSLCTFMHKYEHFLFLKNYQETKVKINPCLDCKYKKDHDTHFVFEDWPLGKLALIYTIEREEALIPLR